MANTRLHRAGKVDLDDIKNGRKRRDYRSKRVHDSESEVDENSNNHQNGQSKRKRRRTAQIHDPNTNSVSWENQASVQWKD
jgi:hypothetical protein